MASWRRTMWLLMGCNAAISLIYSMMSPLLPLFLGEVGVGSSVQFWAGLSAAATGFTAAIGSPFWGALADKVGKKPLLLRSAFGLVAVLTGFALSRSLTQFLFFRFLQGILIGFQPAAMALAVDQAPRDRRAWMVALFQTWNTAGGIAGPLLGTGMAAAAGAIRPAFWLLTAMAGGISLVVLLGVREERRPPAPTAVGDPAVPGSALALLRQYPALAPLLLVIVVISLVSASQEPVLPLFIPTLAAEGSGLGSVGLAFSAAGAATALAAPWMGRQADRLGSWPVLKHCLAASAAACILEGLAHRPWQLIIGRFLFGLAVGGLTPVATAAISAVIPPDGQGRAFGLSYASTFVGGVLGPLVGGGIGAWLGERWALFVAGLVAAAAWGWLVTALRTEGPTSSIKQVGGNP